MQRASRVYYSLYVIPSYTQVRPRILLETKLVLESIWYTVLMALLYYHWFFYVSLIFGRTECRLLSSVFLASVSLSVHSFMRLCCADTAEWIGVLLGVEISSQCK